MYDAPTITAYFHIDCGHDTPTILIASVGLTPAHPNSVLEIVVGHRTFSDQNC